MTRVVAALSLGALVLAAGLAVRANAPTPSDLSPELVVRGEKIFARCQACHSLERNRTGPRLCDVVGRPAGSVPGFRYSPALGSGGFVWDEEKLLSFIEDPRGTVPGTFMGYAGVRDAEEREALLAFLAQAALMSECTE